MFGIGASWGGYESLAVPTTGFITRTAGTGKFAGPVVRIHIGLEDVDDLIADLRQGLDVMRKHLIPDARPERTVGPRRRIKRGNEHALLC